MSADETADVGIDLGTPVVEAIGSEARSSFNGHIPKVTSRWRNECIAVPLLDCRLVVGVQAVAQTAPATSPG